MRNALPRRRLAAGVLTLGLAAAISLPAATVTGAAHAEGDQPAVEGDVPAEEEGVNRLTVATSQSVENWNPFLQIYVIEHQFRQVQYEPLVHNSAEDYAPTPALAEEWEVSDDGLSWTFTVRDDALWHDGEPVTAHDVEYTYHIIQTDDEISARNEDIVELIDSVTATDDRTVVFELTEPTTQLEATDQVIVPRHIWEEHEGAWSDFANDEFPIVGSGAFQIVEYETDQFIRYEAFDDYFRGRPGFDELVFRYYTEPDTAVAALEVGEVDIIGGLNDAQHDRLDGQDGIGVNVAPDRRWTALRFNTGAVTRDGQEFGEGHPALEDVRVRQALHHAIDKEALVDRVLAGYGDPATSIVPNVFETIWWEPSDDQRVEFDLDEANRILDEAGYPMGDDGIRVTEDGEPLVFTFGVDANMTDRESASQFIEEWWAEIGVGVEITVSEDVHDQFYAGQLDLTFTGWGINPNPTYNFNRQSCAQLPTEADGSSNDSDAYYCNEELDALNRQQQSETDPQARAETLREMQAILYEDAPLIFLWYPTVTEAYNDAKIDNIVTQPSENGMIMGQIGSWAYHGAAPTGTSGDDGGNPAVVIGAAVAAVAAVGVIGFVLYRRRQTADERE